MLKHAAFSSFYLILTDSTLFIAALCLFTVSNNHIHIFQICADSKHLSPHWFLTDEQEVKRPTCSDTDMLAAATDAYLQTGGGGEFITELLPAETLQWFFIYNHFLDTTSSKFPFICKYTNGHKCVEISE